MYKRILVPIDGSGPSALGLAEAIVLAKNQGAALRLVHVVNELIIPGRIEIGWSVMQLIDRLRENGAAILKDGESLVRAAGVEVDTRLIEEVGNHAGRLLVQEAKDWHADLIAMGTHGRHGIRRAVMGSDAEFVVRHTPVPVLLVRSQEAAQG